jgi:hypothetical protein
MRRRKFYLGFVAPLCLIKTQFPAGSAFSNLKEYFVGEIGLIVNRPFAPEGLSDCARQSKGEGREIAARTFLSLRLPEAFEVCPHTQFTLTSTR